MKISGLTTCVGYSEQLAESLPTWSATLDHLIVVTTPNDTATRSLCGSHNVPMLTTNAFSTDGAAFNKAAAMEEGLRHLPADDWILFFDADVVPPPDWRERIEVTPGNLYGASREGVDDRELAGFFHLFCASELAAQHRPLLGSWHNASGYDTEFARRWPSERRIRLPLTLKHLGEPGRNWCGVGGDTYAMKRNRILRGGYAHERLA